MFIENPRSHTFEPCFIQVCVTNKVVLMFCRSICRRRFFGTKGVYELDLAGMHCICCSLCFLYGYPSVCVSWFSTFLQCFHNMSYDCICQVAQLWPRAFDGDPEAQFRLASCYESGVQEHISDTALISRRPG